MPEMISFGGGINSTAMTILLINEGWKGPIVFADTGAEKPETYCHLKHFEENFLQPRGMIVTTLAPPTRWHKAAPEFLEEYCLERRYIPIAYLRWCTSRWKVQPLTLWAEEYGYSPVLLGIDASEGHRAKERPNRAYPLIERCIDRRGCIKVLKSANIPVPIKSSCFFCPFQTYEQWRWLHNNHPDLYERAAIMERRANERRTKRYATLNPAGLYTLDELAKRFQAQIVLPGFDEEYLREFQSCVCGL